MPQLSVNSLLFFVTFNEINFQMTIENAETPY